MEFKLKFNIFNIFSFFYFIYYIYFNNSFLVYYLYFLKKISYSLLISLIEMDLSNLIMIIIVVCALTFLMSNHLNKKEETSKSNTLESSETVNSMLQNMNQDNTVNNSNGNNQDVVNSNISGNNVNVSKENFNTTESIVLSIESYPEGYQFNVDLVKNSNDKYHIELYNPKQKMYGVLHKSPNQNPIIASKDSTNMNQQFKFEPLTNEQKEELNVTTDAFVVKSLSQNENILHYDGQLSLQPVREGMKIKIGHVFLSRSESKSEGVYEYELNKAAELDKTFNFDGTISVNDYNNNLFKLVQNINRKVENLYRREQAYKDESNETNGIIDKPLVVNIASSKNENKAPFINLNSGKKSMTERFEQLDDNSKNNELQQLIQETIVSSNSGVKCPQLDNTKYIHKKDVNCFSCSQDLI